MIDSCVSSQLSLANWLSWLESTSTANLSSVPDPLEAIKRVKLRLGQVPECPVILVAGTNGKGSTCAFLEAILISAGYNVGTYTSPHLISYNERIRINGNAASDDEIVSAFCKVEAARNGEALSYFAFSTLAAWEVFLKNEMDVVILEAGLGGRLDPTNIYSPSCSVITTIDLDHTAVLGDTRELIGREKAGILREDTPAICGDRNPPTSLLAHAASIGISLQVAGVGFGYRRQATSWHHWGQRGYRNDLPLPAMRGEHQFANASAAIAALDALNEILPTSEKDIRQGLVAARVSGRFHILDGPRTIILDVAHNAESVRALAENLKALKPKTPTWAVWGMLHDKDIKAVAPILGHHISYWMCCTLDGPRGATSDHLADALVAQQIRNVQCFESPAAGLEFALKNSEPDERIVVFGSFQTVSAVMRQTHREN